MLHHFHQKPRAKLPESSTNCVPLAFYSSSGGIMVWGTINFHYFIVNASFISATSEKAIVASLEKEGRCWDSKQRRATWWQSGFKAEKERMYKWVKREEGEEYAEESLKESHRTSSFTFVTFTHAILISPHSPLRSSYMTSFKNHCVPCYS